MINKKVVKRDGQIVNFDTTKIENAILKAMRYGSGILDVDIAKLISLEAKDILAHENESHVNIEDIEKFVFERLIHHGHEHTARAYEGYRSVQAFKRENKTNTARFDCR